MKNKEQGITLIALIITIIILLLLAAVAWGALNDGIIRNADRSVNLFNRQANADQEYLNSVGRYFDTYAGLAPDVADITDEVNLPEKKALSEFPDYIPIYTIAQYAKIGSGEQGYVIQDLTGTYVGTYNMNNNAKYVIMNDLDFSSQSLTEILPEFKGELEGNGCTIKNIKIDATQSNVAYSKLISAQAATETPAIPGGMFVRLSGGTIKNLLVENANVNSLESAGAIVAQSYNATIDNCYVKNSNIKGGTQAGGILGLDFTGSTITNCKNINTKVDCEFDTYGRYGKNGEARYRKMTGGIVGISFNNITLENNQTISTEEPLDLRGGIISQALNFPYYIYEGLYEELGMEDNSISVNIVNCHANNINLSCGVYSAGIVGDISDVGTHDGTETINVNISKCTAKKIRGDGAGIVSNIYGNQDRLGSIHISECNVQDIKFIENPNRYYTGVDGSTISGIIGTIKAEKLSLEIDNCHVKGMYVNSKDNPGIHQCAGILTVESHCEKDITINNCTVEDLHLFVGIPAGGTISDYFSYFSGYGYSVGASSCGGIVGYIYSSPNPRNSIKYTNLSVSNIEIYNEYGNAGGIVGGMYSYASDVLFEKCTGINVDLSDDGGIYCRYSDAARRGGILGGAYANDNNVQFKNCSIDNINIGEIKSYGGGILGDIYCPKSLEINNCNASNFVAVGKSIPDCWNYGACIGGIAGSIYSFSEDVKIENSKSSNIKITSIGGYGNLGGIIGSIDNANTEISNCTANKIYLYSEQLYIDDALVYQGNIRGGAYGAILGFGYDSNDLDIVDCNVSDIEISSIYGQAGGILGAADFRNVNVENCNVLNAKVIGLINCGGIAGYINDTNSEHFITVKDSTVKDSEVKNVDFIIEDYNVNITNVTYTTVGGILGGGYDSEVYGCTVDNVEIKEKTYNYVTASNQPRTENIGGIAGYAGKITNCNVLNSNISAECIVESSPIEERWRYANSNLGGILGYGYEVTGCNIKNSKVEHKGERNYVTAGILGHAYYDTTTIRDCNVENTEIIGKALTGGICSATATNLTIDNCTVKDSTVKGTDRVGGLLGMSYDGSTNTDLTLNLINSKIQNTNILGKNDYDYYIGWIMPEEKTPVLTSTSYDSQTTKGTY